MAAEPPDLSTLEAIAINILVHRGAMVNARLLESMEEVANIKLSRQSGYSLLQRMEKPKLVKREAGVVPEGFGQIPQLFSATPAGVKALERHRRLVGAM